MTTKHVKRTKLWNAGLWILQVSLAAMFLMVGLMKTFTPIAELSRMVPLAGEMPGLIRFIGISEVAGALGLILPAALRVQPRLTAIAAGALAVVMFLSMVFHISRGEYTAIGTPILLGILAALVAFGRLSKAPIPARFSGTQEIVKN